MAKEKFETSLDRLEKIVEDLEAGELSLDETLKLYEEGVKLSRLCSKVLHEAEKKIEVLSKEGDTFELSPFEGDEEESPKKTKPKKKS